jgi:leukotriene-A4 hydrolase
MIPCQDTPSVKSPYEIEVTCKDPLVVACSGVAVSEPKKKKLNGVDYITYHFEQKIKIPAYLIALTCGALVRGKIGPRSFVWCEKEYLEASIYEFGETEDFLKSGEKICSYPYVWKTYDLMVLPGAFPYGGMENPNLTFISASLITGDRSLTDVIAHEITHSWSGNLVTNQTWSDFWLNEGFT